MTETIRHTIRSLRPKTGEVIKGEHSNIQLGNVLGQGTYADVFHAYARNGTQVKEVAAKVLALEKLDGRPFTQEQLIKNRERALEERGILASLVGYPNILPFILYEEKQLPEEGRIALGIDSIPIIGTMIANRGTLTQRLHQMSLVERVDALTEIATGVQYAHAQGIVHGDIKPDNVLCHVFNHEENEVRLLGDWGVAKQVDGISYQDEIRGTWSLTAPERLKGIYTTANDIYTLSAVTYKMITGHEHFDLMTTSIMPWIEANRHDPFIPIRSLPDIHPAALAFQDLIEAASEKDFRNRPTIQEIVNELGIIREDIATSAETDKTLRRPLQAPQTQKRRIHFDLISTGQARHRAY